MVSVVKVVTQPTVEPVSLDTARRHLSLFATGDPPAHWEDPWIEEKLPSCRQFCEKFTQQSLAPQTLEIALDAFPYCRDWPHGWRYDRPYLEGYGYGLALPMGPVVAIEAVTYIDAAGAPQTLAPELYELDDFSDPPLLKLVYGQTWPSARRSSNAVRVRYVAGFAGAHDTDAIAAGHPLIEALTVAGLLLVLSHFHENREATVAGLTIAELPLGVQACLFPSRSSIGV